MERADEVQLTVSTVRFDSGWGRRKGACSTFLADRAEDAILPIFVQRSSHFHPPDDPAAPMIMVGPGTGVAPFRAFLQERRATGARGDNWLFFGEQHAASDFYYRDEIASWRCDGRLSRLDLAFSRDVERRSTSSTDVGAGAELWRWLERGAHFYVCGDAERMAKDVDIVLRMVVSRHGGLSEDDADAYVNRMAQGNATCATFIEVCYDVSSTQRATVDRRVAPRNRVARRRSFRRPASLPPKVRAPRAP